VSPQRPKRSAERAVERARQIAAMDNAMKGLTTRIVIILSYDGAKTEDLADLENTAKLLHMIAAARWSAHMADRTPRFPPETFSAS